MNLLVTALYRLENEHNKNDAHRYERDEHWALWREAERLCAASYERHLINLDEHITLAGECVDYDEMFQRTFWDTYELWQEMDANILAVGVDTFCMRPTEVFERFDGFRMFNLANPKSENRLGMEGRYLNAEVCYLPATMRETVWRAGIEAAKGWNSDVWGYIQHVYNRMAQAEGLETLHPELNFPLPLINAQPNDGSYEGLGDARILHFHGSRGIRATVEMMRCLSA